MKWGFFQLARSSRRVGEPALEVFHRVAHALVGVKRGRDLLHPVPHGGPVAGPDRATDLRFVVLGQLLREVHGHVPRPGYRPALALAPELAGLEAELLSCRVEDLGDAA